MLEVIAHNIEDVKKISETRAERIELCTDLDQDGLTPSIEFVKAVLEVTTVPVRIMVRPNNSFKTSDLEIENMCEYIKEIKALNHRYVDGFVFGYLDEDQKIDLIHVQKLIQVSKPYAIVFHKASDAFITNMRLFEELGIDTVLTQGGTRPILENLDKLKKLKNEKSKVELLIGGGVNLENIKELSLISKNIHIGSLARKNKSYDFDIDQKMIEKIVTIIEEE